LYYYLCIHEKNVDNRAVPVVSYRLVGKLKTWQWRHMINLVYSQHMFVLGCGRFSYGLFCCRSI